MAIKPQPTPWGELIRVAREAQTPRMSVKAAAELAGISPENWGHVERGYQAGRGRNRRVTGTPSTVAHMAYVVGLSPDRLVQAGNPAAAAILTEMVRSDTEAPSSAEGIDGYGDPTLDHLARTPGLPEEVVRGLIVIARQMRESSEGTAGSR